MKLRIPIILCVIVALLVALWAALVRVRGIVQADAAAGRSLGVR